MSWHFLQEQVAESWAHFCLDGAPDALLRLMPTVELHFSRANGTESLNLSRSGMTCAHSTDARGAGQSMSYQVDSLVKTSVQQALGGGSMVSGQVCGWKWPASFAKWNPNSRGWKTRQLSLLGDSDEFSETWPRWGLMRDGECSPLETLEHDTSVRGSFVLPTVVASWDRRGPGLSNNLDNLRASLSVTERTLRIVKHYGWRWPTPVLEWMMMWPEGWSALTPLATDRFRARLLEHGECSAVSK